MERITLFVSAAALGCLTAGSVLLAQSRLLVGCDLTRTWPDNAPYGGFTASCNVGPGAISLILLVTGLALGVTVCRSFLTQKKESGEP